MNDFDRIAQEADEGSAGNIGTFNRLNESGRLLNYLLVYEFIMEDGEKATRVVWMPNGLIWALGAARYAEPRLLTGLEDVEPED